MKEKIKKFSLLDWIVLFGGMLILLIMVPTVIFDLLEVNFRQVFIHLIGTFFGLYVVYTRLRKFKNK